MYTSLRGGEGDRSNKEGKHEIEEVEAKLDIWKAKVFWVKRLEAQAETFKNTVGYLWWLLWA